MTDVQKDLNEIKGTLEHMKESIKELEHQLRIKEQDDKVFEIWQKQYDDAVLPPTQGCNCYNEDGTLKKEYTRHIIASDPWDYCMLDHINDYKRTEGK